MTAVIAGGMAAPPLAPPPALQQQLLPQAQAPLPAARLDAYTKVMRIFLQGSYDLAKEEALASLRSALFISEQEHLSVKAAAMADVQHHLQLHPPAPQAPAAPELSVGHSSQPAGGGGRSGAAAKRPSPAAAAKRGGAAPRKRTRAGEAAGGGGAAARNAAARGQAAGPAVPAPRAAGGVALDPLVGHVVMRHWPADGGWFRGVISDFNPDNGSHCIIYDLGSSSESFEWYRIRGASQQDCMVQEEKVDFAMLAPPPAPGAAATAKSKKSPAGGAASGAAARSTAGASKQGGGAAAASKAASARAAGAAKPAAGAAKPAAARAAAAKPVARPAATPSPAPSPAQQTAAAAPQPQPAPPHRNGKTHALHGGLSSHAAALKQALASGARPPYLNGHTLLPRRSRSWSSDEDSSDDEDDE